MDHLLGQRFNLISKSEIRYLGTLHEINSDDSTIALEDVYSFGTEDRKVANFIPPSSQQYEYIVFRGGDVKDIKIADEQQESKQPQQGVPNDPAILNSSRPGPGHPSHGPPPRDQSPFHPQGYGPPPPQFGGYYPPGPQYGRGFGGPPPPGGFAPGPGFQGMPPYGPPPGYYGPQGQGFSQGPNPFQPPPVGAPGPRPQPPNQQQQPPPPSGPPPMRTPKPTSELPVDNKAPTKPSNDGVTPTPSAETPATSSDAKPSFSEALMKPQPSAQPTDATKAAIAATTSKLPPSGPKNSRVAPAVPFAVNQKSFIPPVPGTTNGPLSSTAGNASSTSSKPASSQAAMETASRQAKEAVAAAMAKLNPQAATAAPKPASNAAAVDALTKKVNEMKTPSAHESNRGRANYRGSRGGFQRNGSGGQPTRKIEIPKSDYDFESANAKFNKEDLIKEAIATGSPIGEKSEDAANGMEEPEASVNGDKRKDSLSVGLDRAYDKKSSFFDDISSELKDREERAEGGRGVRGEEYKKNLETFGQGNVDGGYGRGRGRGGYGRGRQYGGNYRGYSRGSVGRGRGDFGGYRGRGRGGSEGVAQTSS